MVPKHAKRAERCGMRHDVTAMMCLELGDTFRNVTVSAV
jgi:hypothetical protein